jgi:hypothetical protein
MKIALRNQKLQLPKVLNREQKEEQIDRKALSDMLKLERKEAQNETSATT